MAVKVIDGARGTINIQQVRRKSSTSTKGKPVRPQRGKERSKARK